jgi:DNA-binding CsgD family transcriptional regulator
VSAQRLGWPLEVIAPAAPLRSAFDDVLDQWPPLLVLHGTDSYGRMAQLGRWASTLPLGAATVVWMTATRHAAEPRRFWTEITRAMGSSGLGQPVSPDSSGVAAIESLDRALLAMGEGRRLLLVVDDFHHVVDREALADLVGLVQRHRHFHLYVQVRGRHPVEALAEGTVEIRSVPTRERSAVRQLGADWPWWPDGMTHPAQRYLMQLSLIDELDRPLVVALCGDPHPDRILAELEHAGLLERHYRGDQISFSLPGLSRDILRARYLQADPAGAREFHGRLAAWHLDRGGSRGAAMALSHAVAAGTWALVERTWDEHAVTLQMCHPDVLADALNAVPLSLIAGCPAMALARTVLNAGAHGAASSYWLGAASLFGGERRDAGLPSTDLSLPNVVYVGAVQIMGLRHAGRLAESMEVAEAVQARISMRGPGPAAGNDRLGWFHLQWGISLTLAGDARAEQVYRRAWEYGLASSVAFIPAKAAANLALIYAMRGEAGAAQTWLDRHRRFLDDDLRIRRFVEIGAKVAEGILALDRMVGSAASAILDELDQGFRPVELQPFVTYLRAEHALHHGDPETVLADLRAVVANDAAIGGHGERGVAGLLLTRALADLLLATGRAAEVRQLLRARESTLAIMTVPAARFHLLVGDYSRARRVAECSEWQPVLARADRVELLLIHAVAAYRQGDEAAAGRLTTRALDARAHGAGLQALAAIPYIELMSLLALAARRLAPAEVEILAAARPMYPASLVVVELSERERSVLTELARTTSRHEIARALYVSINTVKTQLASAYYKLGVTTREQALLQARTLGFLEEAEG